MQATIYQLAGSVVPWSFCQEERARWRPEHALTAFNGSHILGLEHAMRDSMIPIGLPVKSETSVVHSRTFNITRDLTHERWQGSIMRL